MLPERRFCLNSDFLDDAEVGETYGALDVAKIREYTVEIAVWSLCGSAALRFYERCGAVANRDSWL